MFQKNVVVKTKTHNLCPNVLPEDRAAYVIT